MKGKYILSIDCGTQSIRSLIVDKRGNIIGIEKQSYEPYFSLNPGWAEQDPLIYWKSACITTKKLKEKYPKHWNKIAGVTVTTLRDTSVCLDKNNKILRPSILWLDQRKSKCKKNFSWLYEVAFRIIGMRNTIKIIRKNSAANWIKENEPEIWKKTKNYILISGFFNLKLTGNIIDSYASQIGHIPFNYKKMDWEKNKNNYRWLMFGVDRDKLPPLVSPGTEIGKISEKASIETGLNIGIPVFAGGSDKGCETLANGCINESTASISFGTTATIQIMTKKYIEPIKFMPSYPAVINNFYNPEIEIFRGYWMISWFKREFAEKEVKEAQKLKILPEELLNQRLSEISPGSDGLILQPYWGPHIKTPNARGSIIGFSDVHTRIHIYKAIIEGINFALIEGLEKIERKTHKKVKTLFVSGGGSQSDAICQITSDMFDLPVKKIHTYEASGLGAAIIGFVGLKEYKNYEEAIQKMVSIRNTYYPNTKNSVLYKNLYKKVYKNIYPNLKKIYNDLKEII